MTQRGNSADPISPRESRFRDRRRRHAARARARRAGAARAARRRAVRDRRHLHALRRPARDRAARRRYGALPLASRLLQPAHRRGASRAGAGPGLLLARRAAGLAPSMCGRSSTPVEAAAIARAAAGTPAIGRHRRRRRGGQRRRRDAPPRGLRRPHHDAERR